MIQSGGCVAVPDEVNVTFRHVYRGFGEKNLETMVREFTDGD